MIKTAVILAAGMGSKLWPYDDFWPKPAISIGGVPNIERTIRLLKQSNVQRIIVVTHHLAQRLRASVGDHKEVEFIQVPYLQGTANTLSYVLPRVTDEQVLVVYGDLVFTQQIFQDFFKQVDSLLADGYVLSQALGTEPIQNGFGLQVRAQQWVEQIYAHPRPHYVNQRLLGLYVLPTQTIKTALEKNPGFMRNVSVGVMPKQEAELEQSIQWMIDHGKKIAAIQCSLGVVDMDKPWHLMEANQLIIDEEMEQLPKNQHGIPASASIHPTAELGNNVFLGEQVEIGRHVWIKGNAIIRDGTVIDNGVTIDKNVIIGKNCTIENFAKIGSYTTIGDYNRFGHCAEFMGVTFDRVSFVHYGEVYGVVGEATDIAAGVTVGIMRFDDQLQIQHVKGRREIPYQYGNAIYIGDFTRTGILSQFMPGVKIGSYCAIGAGVRVDIDIPARTLLISEQKIVQKSWGPERYGW